MIPSLPPDQIVDQVDVIVVFHHQILTEHENMGHQGNLASTFIPKENNLSMPKKTYYNQYNIEIRLWSSNHLCPLRWRLRSGIHERSTLMSTSPHWSSNILGTTASLPGHLDPGQMPRLWQPNNIINNQLGQHSNTHTQKKITTLGTSKTSWTPPRKRQKGTLPPPVFWKYISTCLSISV